MPNWTEVDDTATLEEGDTVRTYYCVAAPQVPFSDVYAELVGRVGQLTGSVNQQLPQCAEAEVVDTELQDNPEGEIPVVNGKACDYTYIVTSEITRMEPGCEVTANDYASWLHVAIAAVAILIGLSLVFWRMEKLAEESPGSVSRLTWAALLAAAGYAISQGDQAFGGEETA